jgi:hypothetical protein
LTRKNYLPYSATYAGKENNFPQKCTEIIDNIINDEKKSNNYRYAMCYIFISNATQRDVMLYKEQ